MPVPSNIMLALDNKEMTSITFADVSKALDRIWIRGLILKLVHMLVVEYPGMKPD
jgi:hypothetical protein